MKPLDETNVGNRVLQGVLEWDWIGNQRSNSGFCPLKTCPLEPSTYMYIYYLTMVLLSLL